EALLVTAAHTAPGTLAVAGVQVVDDVHAFHDATEWGEALCVETRVVDDVDVELRVARVGARHREADRAADVARAHGVVGEGTVLPDARDRGISRDAELRDETRHHPKEARVVEEAGTDEVVEPIDTARCPRAFEVDHESALRRLDAHARMRRCRLA